MNLAAFVARIWRIQFARFGVIGTAAFVVDSLVLYGAFALGFGLYSGRALSYLAAATFTWYGNRRITFTTTRALGVRAATREWAKFLAANLVGGTVNYATYAALVNMLPLVRAYPVLGVAAGSVAGLGVNFVLSKFVVFRARPVD